MGNITQIDCILNYIMISKEKSKNQINQTNNWVICFKKKKLKKIIVSLTKSSKPKVRDECKDLLVLERVTQTDYEDE